MIFLSIFARGYMSGQKSHNFQISAMDLPSVPHSPSCMEDAENVRIFVFFGRYSIAANA